MQSGWLWASQRALADDATELHPTHTTSRLMPPTGRRTDRGTTSSSHSPTLPGRYGYDSHRRWVTTAVWEFVTIDNGETVTVAMDADHLSRLLLVVTGVDVRLRPPACGRCVMSRAARGEGLERR